MAIDKIEESWTHELLYLVGFERTLIWTSKCSRDNHTSNAELAIRLHWGDRMRSGSRDDWRGSVPPAMISCKGETAVCRCAVDGHTMFSLFRLLGEPKSPRYPREAEQNVSLCVSVCDLLLVVRLPNATTVYITKRLSHDVSADPTSSSTSFPKCIGDELRGVTKPCCWVGMKNEYTIDGWCLVTDIHNRG